MGPVSPSEAVEAGSANHSRLAEKDQITKGSPPPASSVGPFRTPRGRGFARETVTVVVRQSKGQ